MLWQEGNFPEGIAEKALGAQAVLPQQQRNPGESCDAIHMNWLKAYIIFVIAFLVTAFINIDRISLWTDEAFKGQYGSPAFRIVRKAKSLYRGSAVAAYSGKVDCAFSGLFNENYRSSLTCDQNGNPVLGAENEEEDEYYRLSQPVLKDMRPVEQDELLAALELVPKTSGTGTPQSALTANAAPAAPGSSTASPASDEAAASLPGTENAAAIQEVPQGAQQTAATEPLKPVEVSIAPEPLPPPHKILVVGDSLAIGLALSLRRAVTGFDEMVLIDEGKVSSGLANPKYYNWEKALASLVEKYDPNIVVVMMGANDAKYIKPNEKPRPPDAKNKSWPQVFSMRVENFLKVLAEKNILTYWIGLPIMGDPGYALQAQAMNVILKGECAKFNNAHYLDTWSVLADENGEYSTFLATPGGSKVKVRANDKIHFTVAGSDILTRFFFQTISKDVALQPKVVEETAMAPEAQAASKNPVKVQ